MARIKVTGYMYTADMDVEDVDTTNSMGLSEQGYERYSGTGMVSLTDIDFELVKE